MVYKSLKRLTGISQTKWGSSEIEQAKRCGNSSLVYVGRFHRNLVISHLDMVGGPNPVVVYKGNILQSLNCNVIDMP